MKISIITPSYNQKDYLEQTIKSVWSQKGDFELEHIIADGGSTDETVTILKKYQRIYEQKLNKVGCKNFVFKWWSKKDNGQSEAIMKGFNVSTGDVVNWINSDDYFSNDKALEKIIEAFKVNNTDIVVGNGEIADQEGRVISSFRQLNDLDNNKFQKKLKLLRYGDFLCQQSVFIRSEVFKKYRLNENLSYCMDWDLYLRLAKDKVRFYFIPEFIGVIREQENAKTILAPKKYYYERMIVYLKYGGWLSLGFYYSVIKYFFNKNKKIETIASWLRERLPFYKLKV